MKPWAGRSHSTWTTRGEARRHPLVRPARPRAYGRCRRAAGTAAPGASRPRARRRREGVAAERRGSGLLVPGRGRRAAERADAGLHHHTRDERRSLPGEPLCPRAAVPCEPHGGWSARVSFRRKQHRRRHPLPRSSASPPPPPRPLAAGQDPPPACAAITGSARWPTAAASLPRFFGDPRMMRWRPPHHRASFTTNSDADRPRPPPLCPGEHDGRVPTPGSAKIWSTRVPSSFSLGFHSDRVPLC